VNLTTLSAYRENTGGGVIRGVCPDYWKGRVEIGEDVCRNKGRFEELKRSHCGDQNHGASLCVSRVSGTVISEYEAINRL